jgi:hypothetical protein
MYHGGVVVTQKVELEQVAFHGVVFKMSGDYIGLRVVGRALDRTKIIYLLVLGDNDQAARVWP